MFGKEYPRIQGLPHIIIPKVYYREDVPNSSDLIVEDKTFTLASKDSIYSNFPILIGQGEDKIREELLEWYSSDIGSMSQVTNYPLDSAWRVQLPRGQNVMIYDYLGTDQQFLHSIAKTLGIINWRSELGVNMNDYVISPMAPKNNIGIPAKGWTSGALKYTVLFPSALDNSEYRVKGMSTIDGTTAHEWAHQFIGSGFNKVLQRWMEVGEWSFINADPKNSDTTKPDECVSDYAYFVTQEDFGESNAAAFLNPNILHSISKGKFQFMQELHGFKGQKMNTEIPPYKLERLAVAQHPIFPKTFAYTLFG